MAAVAGYGNEPQYHSQNSFLNELFTRHFELILCYENHQTRVLLIKTGSLLALWASNIISYHISTVESTLIHRDIKMALNSKGKIVSVVALPKRAFSLYASLNITISKLSISWIFHMYKIYTIFSSI